ncbi:3-isopropylmalate dehydratase large subunit [Alteribacillus iranensis]|uniref:3-isopropylmalate dehydratase large subunit n=1 Tax=Alteribacillus iranensis TaxID=930128 RepID=A0A1I2BHG2_9BACI|nr:3-isopropylmalate dehydratase large subunit [Alteribacillus iranensis]SFE54713.1 3-isopropylmalate/(R)-2-methylmalate dehydratase large subunit [Alteribacillus iranensis]
MAQTIIEKIISKHAGHDAKEGEITLVQVDGTMASDTTAPLAIQSFENMGGKQVWDPSRVSLVIDHASPAPNQRIANLHSMMREFANQQNIKLYDVGEGICHQLMVENKHVKPGDLFLGADSHTCTYGALGAFATGVGSTDLAGVWLTGKTWVKVPPTIQIRLHGKLQTGVSAKDLVLHLVGTLGIEGATYQAIEYTGEALHHLSLASRMTLANMSIEMGAKAGLVDTIGLEWEDEFEAIHADEDAEYKQVIDVDVSKIESQISVPHSPDHVQPISKVKDTPIQQAFIGSCTNGRLEDLHEAAKILEGNKIAPHVRLIIAPASKKVLDDALSDGTVQILTRAGASFITSGCGPCVGTHQGIPGSNENIISSSNRNFQGRMGNPESNVYLASPAVVAATALHGKITDPSQAEEVGV